MWLTTIVLTVALVSPAVAPDDCTQGDDELATLMQSLGGPEISSEASAFVACVARLYGLETVGKVSWEVLPHEPPAPPEVEQSEELEKFRGGYQAMRRVVGLMGHSVEELPTYEELLAEVGSNANTSGAYSPGGGKVDSATIARAEPSSLSLGPDSVGVHELVHHLTVQHLESLGIDWKNFLQWTPDSRSPTAYGTRAMGFVIDVLNSDERLARNASVEGEAVYWQTKFAAAENPPEARVIQTQYLVNADGMLPGDSVIDTDLLPYQLGFAFMNELHTRLAGEPGVREILRLWEADLGFFGVSLVEDHDAANNLDQVGRGLRGERAAGFPTGAAGGRHLDLDQLVVGELLLDLADDRMADAALAHLNDGRQMVGEPA